jgi:hypothetical protein
MVAPVHDGPPCEHECPREKFEINGRFELLHRGVVSVCVVNQGPADPEISWGVAHDGCQNLPQLSLG